ncbi:MAG: FKBP-type peptidyl-prolyl cis-trans isomerase [Bacteroidales bacterium]|jgi:FKBP-type peptidyl-prolyl cis-trans isomerase FklB|nr:FKBP-type peptidyl-prolyl cis-trans isomerase [Bacteroidales bacterium]
MITTELDKASYALGMNLGASLKNEGIETINAELMTQGIIDMLENNKLQLSITEASQVVQAFLTLAQTKRFEKNIQESQAFLAENAKRARVTTLPSGLQYEILTEGTGAKPSATSHVRTHYHGTLIDGTVFDSSVQRGQPAQFPVNGVIPGWVEALQLMPVGSKWKLFIPSELAYGANPHPGGAIQPHMALVFEVELLDIIK